MAVTNLTGYTWTCTSINATAGYGQFFLNYRINDNIMSNDLNIGYGFDFGGRPPSLIPIANSLFDVSTMSDISVNDVLKFDGGDDATNTGLISWLEANGTLIPPAPSYEVTFVTNGGTSVTKLEDVEELPTPLPTTTKTNNIFVGWFYDSGFEVQAFSGDVISSNITLYAKWYANMKDFYQDVADEIRIKNGETEPIKHMDFAYKIKNIQGAKPEETKTVTPDFSTGNVVVTPTSGKVMSQVTINKDSNLIANNIKKDVTVHGITGSSFIAIELTQAQYDALAVYDNNTYYLIVEE